MKSMIILFSLLILIPARGVEAEEVLYARYPALSPDGSTIAFTYQGDIWTVPSSGGQAKRLTVNEAEDIRPQYSPDGSTILFSSDRYKNFDLFLIPAEGGPARQLTFHTAFDIGTAFTSSGDSVIFTSGRDGWRDIYITSIDGGTPVKLTGYYYEQEYNGRLSADGRYLIYNNGSGESRWWRRDLRTSRNADIFIADRSAGEFTSRRLTDFEGHDIWPVLSEERGEVYFVSRRGDWAQIFKIPFAGGDTEQLTEFTGDGVQWLNSDPRGHLLVFEQDFKIWTLDPEDGIPHEVHIDIATDDHQNPVETKSFAKDVEYYTLSPDGKKIAAVVKGEIFIIPSEKPERGFRITVSPAREQYPAWGADSKTVYYASDRNGNYDIYAADVMTGVEKQLSISPENEVKPLVSPDGKYLAYYRGLDKIIRLDIKRGEETEWVNGNFFDLGVENNIEYGWSPDSKWLTFTMGGPTYETDIYAANLDGRRYNLSRFSEYNYRPRFSADGKLVYYSSWRDDGARTYKIVLTHEPTKFYEASFDSLFMELPEPEKDKKNGEADKKTDTVRVVIDTALITLRRAPAYELSGSSMEPVLTPDGSKFAFIASLMGKPEIWTVNTEDKTELKQLTTSGTDKSYLQIDDDGKNLYFLEGGQIKKIDIESAKVEPLAFTATMEIDRAKLARQKFEESWQMLNTYFYDPRFHGADWEAVREKYTPIVDHIRTDEEFRNLIKEVMGELRASHLNIYPEDTGPETNIKTGYTGIVLGYETLQRQGAFTIEKVIAESPAALAGITPGSYIYSIDGVTLGRTTNMASLLAGKIGHRVTFNITERPGRKGNDFFVKPVDEDIYGDLVYSDWVNSRRAMVDTLSGGRLAYLHIRAMNSKSLQQFEEELVSIAEPRDGVIIDVRNNGGGNIAVHLLGIMVKTPYFYRNFRGFPITSENKMRSKAVEKPMTLLINNYSASNSEIFASGFRHLGLGKIIGEPTAGAVIGTSSYRLIDGTRIRRPSWGAYTAEMEDTDLERREPDILVENLPDDFINNRDPQLKRAVDEMLSEIK